MPTYIIQSVLYFADDLIMPSDRNPIED